MGSLSVASNNVNRSSAYIQSHESRLNHYGYDCFALCEAKQRHKNTHKVQHTAVLATNFM